MLGEPFEKNISAFTEEFIGVFASGCFMHFNKAVAAIPGGELVVASPEKEFLCVIFAPCPQPGAVLGVG